MFTSERVQRRQSSQTSSVQREATSVSDTVKAGTQSTGRSLDNGMLASMGSSFGFDFSGVRIFDDANAAGAARDLQARAFTVGDQIVFGPGQFDPHSTQGQQLLTHELTHVVQNTRAGATGDVDDSATVSEPSDASEREAEHVAAQATSAPSTVSDAAPATVQRFLDSDDFWGTKGLLGDKWGGVADAGIATAWDVAGVIPGVGTASGLVGAGIDGAKSLVMSGEGLADTAMGNLDQADKDMKGASRFAQDMVPDAASAIPIWGTGQNAVQGLWDGASAIDRATGGEQAPLSGDILNQGLNAAWDAI